MEDYLRGERRAGQRKSRYLLVNNWPAACWRFYEIGSVYNKHKVCVMLYMDVNLFSWTGKTRI